MLLRLALLTCAFYLAIAVLAEVGVFVAARIKGSFGYVASPWGWAVWSGVMWLISYSLAWRVIKAWVRRIF
jgi:hypothetical protein